MAVEEPKNPFSDILNEEYDAHPKFTAVEKECLLFWMDSAVALAHSHENAAEIELTTGIAVKIRKMLG